MIEPKKDSAIAQTLALLIHYGFEMRGYTTEELVEQWLEIYQYVWVRLAVIEALYLGRYKAVSVEQILSFWSRRGTPSYHFNHDFERLICRKLPRHLADIASSEVESPQNNRRRVASPTKKSDKLTQPSQSLPQKKPQAISTQPRPSEIATAKERKNIPAPTSVSRQLNQISVNQKEHISQSHLEEKQTTTAQKKSKSPFPYKANWFKSKSDRRGILQFTPVPDVSESYLKLKAVARKNSPQHI